MKLITKIFLAVCMPLGMALTYWVPNATGFQVPELARMIFYHLPCAIICSILLLGLAPFFAFQYLRTKERHWDIRAEVTMELAILMGILTLLTGMLFAKVQWGAPWTWDPRQTSFFIVMLMAGAYFGIRTAFTDREKRAGNSAAFIMSMTMPMLFLLFIYPKLPLVQTLHPNLLAPNGGFDPTYRMTFMQMCVLVGIFLASIYKSRIRVRQLEDFLENKNEQLAHSNDSTTPRVVRTVSVSTQD